MRTIFEKEKLEEFFHILTREIATFQGNCIYGTVSESALVLKLPY